MNQIIIDYKEDLKQYENKNQNETEKPNINEENISEKYLQNFMLIYIWITPIKVNMNQC